MIRNGSDTEYEASKTTLRRIQYQIALSAGGPRGGSGAETMAAKRAEGILCVAYDSAWTGGAASSCGKLGVIALGIQKEQSSVWLLALPSTILPEAVTNLTPVLVQIIEMPSPFKLLITGAAVAIPSVNP